MKTRHPGVGSWIERWARTEGDRTAIVFGDQRRTYADLAERIRRLANGLRALGVKHGDRVAWIGPNHPAFLETLFASATIGAAVVPIDHRLDRDRIARLCDDVGARVVRSADEAHERLIAEQPDTPIDEPIGPDDLCLLTFTSGTTGAPKGIRLTHDAVTWNAVNCATSLDIRGDDVTVAVALFSRAGGTGVNVLPVLFRGGTVIVPVDSSPDDVLRLMDQHHVTLGFASPDLVAALVRSPRWFSANLERLRIFVTGGAPAPERLLLACAARGVTVAQGYGLSEAGPFVSALDPASLRRKLGSVGRPALFVDLRIAGPDGAERASHEIGELLVRGPNVMAGYWNRDDETRRAIDEHGWLRTRDAAYRDADGFLFIVGRMVDAFVVEGEIVHPGTIERVLLRHPSVADACVLGLPGGPVAFVERSPGAAETLAAELRQQCRDQLAATVRPAAIVFVEALPRNANGKVLRSVLRDRHRPDTSAPALAGAFQAFTAQ